MVSSENRTGLYVAVPAYFCLLAAAAFWAYRKMENMKHSGVSDKLSAHYLGGRDFGPLMTAGTLFASLFSGYTVIGVPNEAYALGWLSIRWIPSLMGIVMGYFGTGLRLRKASLIRNHQSPVDFITDRYQSQVLRYTIVFLQVLPTLIYLAAQVIAIKGTFNSIFELDPDSNYPVIIIMALILVFEWIGGLNSVALTDSIQAIVMVLSFIIIPSVLMKNYGGWQDLEPETFPKPEFYQTMTKDQQWDFWQFALVNFSFFTLPHLLQRTYAARDLKSLRAGYAVMTIGPWFTSFVGIFMGTVGVAILANDDGTPASVSNPFAAILEEMMNLGGFAMAAGTVAVTASLAAIMSTADSLIIAISQLVTVEIVYPLRPNATPTEVAIVGKMVSLFSVAIALLVGIFWDQGISDLGKIQFALSAQAVPAFLFGLFSYNKKTDIHPWCMSGGAFAAVVYVFAVYFGYLKPNTDSIPISSGVTGFLVQVIAAIALEAIRRLLGGSTQDVTAAPEKKDLAETSMPLIYENRPSWDVPLLSRFGDAPLTPQLVWKSMEGIAEPLANPWWVAMMLIVISMSTPLTPESEPPLSPSGTNVFLFAPAIVNGLPWWAFKSILLCIIPTVLLLIAIFKMPDEFPVDERKIETEGIDVNVVELTREEMLKRTSYDESNTSIRHRRSSISQTMDELGIHQNSSIDTEFIPTVSQRRLAMLAMMSSRRLNDVSSQLMDPVKEEVNNHSCEDIEETE